MAILKNITLANGMTVGFWKIGAMYINPNGESSIKVLGYIDKASHDLGHAHAQERTFIMAHSELRGAFPLDINGEPVIVNLIETLDNWLITKPDFTGGIRMTILREEKF